MIGSNSLWVERFQALDDEVMRGVAYVWWDVVGRLPVQPKENQITMELVDSMFLWARRNGLHVEYQFVPFERGADGTIYGSRFVDMAVTAKGYVRSHYLGYECKKLNVKRADGARRSEARDYVDKGMMRFVKGKYARDLPLGCMLGYVMDGDVQWAYTKVTAAVMSHGQALGVQGSPQPAPSIDTIQRFVTQHRGDDRSLEMRHALLPFAGKSASGLRAGRQ